MIFMNRRFTHRLVMFDTIQVMHEPHADAAQLAGRWLGKKMALIGLLSDHDAIGSQRPLDLAEHTIRKRQMVENRRTDDRPKRIVFEGKMLSVTDDRSQLRHLLLCFP